MKSFCLQLNRRALLAFVMALCAILPAFSQQITVQGTVVDETGLPIIGANVIAKGAGVGTATDFDGKFTLSVSSDAVLTVSYIGYEAQEVPVNGQTQITVTLKENSVVLDEVVAIGYGTVKKEDATGAVSMLKPDEIEAGLATSAQDLLVGKSPGVVVTSGGGDPQAGATIRIRGGASLNANNDPLIVIDGVPIDNTSVQGMSNPLAMVSPDNVESMSVLKDASATAIYGSRASNGVIIITTKKGTAGKPQVNFSANMYINRARNTWDVLSADEYRAQMIAFWGEDSEAVRALGTANTNWQDEVLRTTISHDYNLSVGGTAADFLPYRVSVSYTRSNGIIKTSSMDRLTAGINLTPKFFDNHLSVQANVKGYYFHNNFGSAGAVGAAVAMDPTAPVRTNYETTGDTGLTMFNGYTTTTSGGLYNQNSTQNPVSVLMDRDNYANVLRSNGNLQLDYSLHFLPELHLNLNLGYDYSRTEEYNTIAANSPTSWNNYMKNGASVQTYTYQHKLNTLLDFYANYKKEFDQIESMFDITAGYSWQNFDNNGWNNNGVFQTLGYSLAYADGVYNLNYDPNTEANIGKVYNNQPDYHWANELQLLSFFGRLNYSFKDTYLLTFTLRGDATSRFSKDNRWGVFPSTALAWKITNMDFFENARDVMNEFKLRLGWGVTGQQDIGSYFPYMAVYQESTQPSSYPSIVAPGSNGSWTYIPTLYPGGYDPNIKWEETTTYNAGIDVAFLNNRITASLDWYLRDTRDLLCNVTVPIGSATTNQMDVNIGTMRNIGVEFAISARPVVTKDFTWTVDYNVAWNDNEITKLNTSDDPNAAILVGGISGGTGNTAQIHKVGYPAFSFYLFEQVYDANGNPIENEYVDQNHDGQITDDDRVIRYQKDPKVTMSLSNTFNYKNWDFGFVLRANIGNYVYNNVLAQRSTLQNTWSNSSLGNLVDNDFYFSGVETGPNRYYSDYFLRNASFLRCDNITLGYTWESLLKDRLRLRLFAAVQNPFVITKYNGLDPEVFGGIDNDVYPRPTTYSIGLVANF